MDDFTWRLRTQDMLLRWGINVDGVCVQCKACSETQDHILFGCRFSKRIWQSVLNWLKCNRTVMNWEQEWRWIQGRARSRRPQM